MPKDNEYRPSSPYVTPGVYDGPLEDLGRFRGTSMAFSRSPASLLKIWTSSCPMRSPFWTRILWHGSASTRSRIEVRLEVRLQAQEHIVRQEDIPLVSNFGVSFSLQPWNFFELNTASNPPAEL